MTASETEEYFLRLKSRGSRPGLDAVRALAHKLGDPQEGIRAIHISGTNGKGSVLAYLTAILKAEGLKSGCFFSPAMHDERETVCAGGRPVSLKDWYAYWGDIAAAEEELDREGGPLPTFFEALTVLAFMHFKKKECSVAVVECGMGGGGDATNILTGTEVCVFTPIDCDHCQYLGKDIAAIAKEKSGIIKPGAIVVSAIQKEDASAVIKSAAKKAGCEYREAEMPQKVRYGLNVQSFELKAHGRLKIRLAGVYQPDNAALAVRAAEALKDKGIRVSDSSIREGLEAAQWYGRFSVLEKKPYIIADGAHNEAGATVLKKSLDTYFPEGGYLLLMGVLRDKDYEKILRILSERAVYLISLTPPDNPRALDAMALAEAAATYIGNVTAAGSVEEGLEMAMLLAGDTMPVIACGSLSWLYRFREALKGRKKHR